MSYVFPAPLQRGRLIKKLVRFVALVELDGVEYRCYLPPTVKIGDFHLEDLPCLVHPNPKKGGRTTHTVKAISLDEGASWIGVDLGFSNKLVEHFAHEGVLNPLFGDFTSLKREQVLGSSKLDFHVDDLWLEVKTPVDTLHRTYGPSIRLREEDASPVGLVAKTNEVERRQVLNPGRMEQQVRDMQLALARGERAALLTVHQYVPDTVRPYRQSTKKQTIVDTLQEAYAMGLESWKLNLLFTPEEVKFQELIASRIKR